MAGGVGGDGVAAFEYAEGAAFVELEAEAVEAVAFLTEGTLGTGREFELELFEAQPDRSDFHSKIERDDAFVSDVETLGAQREIGAQGVSDAGGHFVGALALLTEEIERATEAAAGAEFVDTAALDENAVADLIGERLAQVGDVFVEFAARVDDEFGGGGWSGCADIGDKIGDGEIGFVADAGDYGDHALSDSARDGFFVESPEIFERAAAASENQHIDGLFAIEKLESADDFESGAVALHADWIQGEVHVVEAAAQDADYVADCGTRGRSDETDAARQHGQRLFAIG